MKAKFFKNNGDGANRNKHDAYFYKQFAKIIHGNVVDPHKSVKRNTDTQSVLGG